MASPAVAAGGDASNDVILGAGSGAGVGFGFLVGLAVGFGVGVGACVAIGGAVGWICLGARVGAVVGVGVEDTSTVSEGEGAGAIEASDSGDGSAVAGAAVRISKDGNGVANAASTPPVGVGTGPLGGIRFAKTTTKPPITRAAPIMSRASRSRDGRGATGGGSGTTAWSGCGGGTRAPDTTIRPGARWTGPGGPRR